MKIYYRKNLPRASVLNFEGLDILRDSIGLPSEKLLSFEFARSFDFKFRACRYITGLNRTSSELLLSFELATSFDFKFERFDILRHSIGLPSEMLLSFEFATSFGFKFLASRYIAGPNRTS